MDPAFETANKREEERGGKQWAGGNKREGRRRGGD